jgi:hypothetical protein
MSSLSFLGNATSYLRIPNTNDFDFGTGDFTIEWYQYQRDNNPFPRIFQVGNYPSVSIGVSIEGGNFYYWSNNSHRPRIFIAPSSYKNKWVHFAISRSSGVTKIFMNGHSIDSFNDTTNFNGANDLIIANESNPANISAFGGYITYFSWVKDVALYTTNFTVSNDYPTLTDDYVLLLKANGFDGTLGNTVTNNNVSTTPNVPPNFLNNNNSNQTNDEEQPNLRNLKSLFSDNSRVYYKDHSLASCGVGTAKNSRHKSKKT